MADGNSPYETAAERMIAINYARPAGGDARSAIQKRLDRVTYFSGPDEEFDEATVEDFMGVVKAEMERYIERQRLDNLPVNLCDFAFAIPYGLGRADLMKEQQLKASKYTT